MRKVSRKEE